MRHKARRVRGQVPGAGDILVQSINDHDVPVVEGIVVATLPVCCGETRAGAARRAEALGEHGLRMLRLGVTGDPGDVTGRLAELASSGADTVYFHLYDVADLDHIRLLGGEVLPRLS